MATYKVLQDIEAEDKFVGPLTLKQFILAIVAGVSGYLAVFFMIKVNHGWILSLPLLPVVLFAGFLAFPWGRDQPTEIWLLAKIRFFLKPRRRIWDQSGIQELVTITAPKKIEEIFAGDNLSQSEVRSRLKALADTIDSRGWAIKNVNVNLYTDPNYIAGVPNSDRLIDATAFAREVPTIDIQAADDMLDERNNPTAQHLNQMMVASTQAHRQKALDQLNNIRQQVAEKPKSKAKASSASKSTDKPADKLFVKQDKAEAPADQYVTFREKTIAPGSNDHSSVATPTTADRDIINRVMEHEDDSIAYGHTKVLEPLDPKHQSHKKHPTISKPKTVKPTMPHTPDPAIIELAKKDWTVSTVAHEAQRIQESKPDDDGVVVNLR